MYNPRQSSRVRHLTRMTPYFNTLLGLYPHGLNHAIQLFKERNQVISVDNVNRPGLVLVQIGWVRGVQGVGNASQYQRFAGRIVHQHPVLSSG